MRIVNEGALYSDRSKLSVAFYLRAQCIRGNMLFFVVVLLVAGVDPNRLIWEGYKRNHKGGVPPQVSTCYLCINTVTSEERT